MIDDPVMRRLRAARPADAQPGDHDALFAQIVSAPGDSRLAGPSRKPWTRPRPRVLAGSTLALAGAAAVLLVALSGSAAPPAYAITRSDDGSVLVNINRLESMPDANRKLTAMGIHEQVSIFMATGPSAVSGPVTCTPAPGTHPSGPALKVLVGDDGTETISPGQTAGNTGVGTFHLDHCTVIAG